MKPEHVTLTIIQSSADDPHRFNVEVAGFGVPDFAIVAKNPKAAKDALKSYVYNELDGKEEISDE